MRSGDFSKWTLPNGTLIPIYDPATTRVENGVTVRDAFPGNKIPANRISPLSAAINRYFPNPNAPGVVRNYLTPGSGPTKRIENAYLLKLDHNFGSANRLTFHLFAERRLLQQRLRSGSRES